MNDRLMSFRVDHPQLQHDIKDPRIGVKRYSMHKNLHSNYLSFGNESYQVTSAIKPTSFSPQPRERYNSRGSSRAEGYSYSPPFHNVRRDMRDNRSNRFSKLATSIFTQPNYTKYNPLVVRTDPINGNSYVQNSGYFN